MLRRLFHIALVLLLLCACGSREAQRLLDQAETVINENSSEAITILESISDDGLSRSQRMRRLLLLTNAQVKCDTVFRSDSIQRLLVDYYESLGTDNERMLAHYLLGLSYYDTGEVPAALESFQKASCCADTISKNFDYSLLGRVYGQMSNVFYDQGMYREAIDHDKLSVGYAWKGKDTLLALRNSEQIAFAYKRLGYTDSAMAVIEDVAKKYNQHGYLSDAVISLSANISPLIQNGDYPKAKKYMELYESYSGLFDSHGNIEAGREIYYKIKGLFFLRTNQLDSAEYYFRKELRDGRDYNNQNAAANGLSELYQRLHQPDSVAKFSLYAYAMSDSLYSQRMTKDIERMQALYNYTRYQGVARQASEKAALTNKKLLVCFIVLLAVLLLSSWLYIARKKVIEILQVKVAELNSIKMENRELKHNATANQQQITENEKRIKQLEKRLGRYGKLVYFGIDKAENDLKKSPNYLQIQEIAYKGQKLSSGHWDSISNLTSEYLPAFYDFVLSQFQIDTTEYRICLLLRLHFKGAEIAHMLGVTAPYISKTSTEILANLYGKRGSSKDLYKELCKIT